MSSTSLKKENLNELSIIFKEKILLNSYRVEDLKNIPSRQNFPKSVFVPLRGKYF